MADDTSPDLPDGLGTALRERVADEHPDLERLISVSTRAGIRLRRRRAAVGALGGVAAVAAVVVAVAVTGDGSAGTRGSAPGLASDPTPTPTPTPSATASTPPTADAAGSPQSGPVVVDDPDWECAEPADEKFTCDHAGASVLVTWRPAGQRQSYLDPAKAGPETYVSEAHGRFFATVVPVQGATPDQVEEVGRALTWVR